MDNIIRLGKDAFDKMEKTAVIYKFCCNNCSSCYVGESKRSLETRLDEHKDYVNKRTVVSNHINEMSHMFDWDNITILDSESNWHKRRISEMLYIHSFNNTLNRKEDTLALSYIYKPITMTLKKIMLSMKV